MKNIIVFGGGMMGEAVAQRLAVIKGYKVTIADIEPYDIGEWGRYSVKAIKCDFAELEKYDLDMAKYDLAVNCAPSKFGYSVAKFILENRVDCVDVAFSEEDPFSLKEIAKKNGCMYVPDAGFAPGLSNLLTGRYLEEYDGEMHQATLLIGGVSACPFDPYGYAVTWSLDDLYEEYVRPARYVADNKIISVDPFDCIDTWTIQGVQVESFASDGLRTLLRYKDKIKNLVEATLRWPGHMEAVKPLVEESKDKFVKTLSKVCSNRKDVAILDCSFWKDDSFDCNPDRLFFTVKGDGTETAMMKTTAGTCAACCEVVLEKYFKSVGVFPLEDLGRHKSVYDAILKILEDKEGIVFQKV